MESVTIKNGTVISLKRAQVQDAADIVNFYNYIGGQTDFLSFGKDEFPNDVKAEEKFIESIEKSVVDIMLLARAEGKLVGIATINTSPKRKFRHVGEMGIGIELDYCGLGLGRAMLDKVLDFARGNGTTKKVNLVTRSDNSRGIALYEKLGFKPEGLLKSESFEGGKYYDSLLMGLFL
ncbi:MAG: GNAT family protein [Oscillospiraceae bacterium]